MCSACFRLRKTAVTSSPDAFAKELPWCGPLPQFLCPFLVLPLREMEKPSQKSIAGKKAQSVKVLVVKADVLNLIPRTDMVEREPTKVSFDRHIDTHTYTTK